MDFIVAILYFLAALPAIRALRRRARGETRSAMGAIRLSVALLLMLVLARNMLGLWVDVLWYRELGAEQRFWTELTARWGAFAIGTIAAFLLLWGNTLLVRRAGRGPARGRPKLSAVERRTSEDHPTGLELGGGR